MVLVCAEGHFIGPPDPPCAQLGDAEVDEFLRSLRNKALGLVAFSAVPSMVLCFPLLECAGSG